MQSVMQKKYTTLSAAVASVVLVTHLPVHAESFSEALTQGTPSGDIRIRYESVDQDNALDDASALTMRTRIGYTTGTVDGFSAVAEFEDVSVVTGMDDYSVPPTGFKTGEYSVIADPEVTELDQGFLMYKSDTFSAKLGRQEITYDNHRFIGNVGWRQDRQTFDGVSLSFMPSEDLKLNYSYLGKRNRIFAEAADVDAKDHLFNANYALGTGKLTGYAYLLEVDNDIDNNLDTYGVRYAGATGHWSYALEYAKQSIEVPGIEFDADYLMAEAGYNLGVVNIKGAYELLGSDDGNYGFSTPLATLHKFNGWADIFLGTPAVGLEDISLSVSGKVGGGKWSVIYHDFSSDTDGLDLGDEIDAVYSRGFGKHYNTGLKLAMYSEGDVAIPDTTKVWLWVGAKF